MKARMKPIFKWILLLGVVLVLAMLAMLPPVADQLSKMTAVPAAKIKAIAQTVATIALGLIVVSWGIAALSLPVLGGVMIVAGLALVAWGVWPLFQSSNDLPTKP